MTNIVFTRKMAGVIYRAIKEERISANEKEVNTVSFNPNFERKPIVTEVTENGIDLTEDQLSIDSDTSEFVPTFFNKK